MGTTDSSPFQPQQVNNNPQTVTPNFQNLQPYRPTAIFTPPSAPEHPKKKLSIKKILLYLFGLIFLAISLLVGVVYFSVWILHKSPYLVIVPKVIPIGYVRKNTIQSEESKDGRFFIFTYNNSVGNKFTYHL